MKKWMSKFLIALLALPVMAMANEDLALDKAPINTHDFESLQRGAKLFTNYCLNCHSAGYMRYNRLQDLGLTEQQIKENFIFSPDTKTRDRDHHFTYRDARHALGLRNRGLYSFCCRFQIHNRAVAYAARGLCTHPCHTQRASALAGTADKARDF